VTKEELIMLALKGINILDLLPTRVYPGAFSTWILGDLGAEVINIEPPPEARAQVAKTIMALTDEEERKRAAYDPINRNKKSVALNLKTEEGRHIFYQLAEKADIIVEGFRPGVVKRLGVDYETIAKINPKIIYCSMSGYGQDGPYHDLPGHDINYVAMGGALNLIGDREGKPVIPLNLVGDIAGATLHATVGILTALIARGKTGKGQHIDISYTDSVISLVSIMLSRDYFQNEIIPKRGESCLSGAYPYYSIYETKDGRFVTIGCVEPWLWENLCRVIGREDFIPFYIEHEHFYQPPENRKWEEISAL
jgi:crotonobetainyl-CoA:carnitine CoA-transferase CaiB-like acyl-CoA transferase